MAEETCAQCRKYADSLESEAYCFDKDEVVASTGWCEEFVHHSRRFCPETEEEWKPLEPAPLKEENGA
jgi:glutaredoxin-related protein